MQLTPDISFIRKLSAKSRSDLKQCMQCGTCSVICDLAPYENPFPRKEMFLAGWGMKEELMNNPDIWLCHQCGDCTTYCPRDVKPGDVLSALREEAYIKMAKPSFMAHLAQKQVYLPLIIGLISAIILLILYLANGLTLPAGTVNYGDFFPHAWLNGSFTLFTILIYSSFFIGLSRFTKQIKSQYKINSKLTTQNLFTALQEIVLHKQFNKCRYHKYRYFAHGFVMWGFIILLIVTLLAIVSIIFWEYPLGLWNPIKILGNFGALLLFIGTGQMIWQRLFKKTEAGNSSYSDWYFLICLFFLVVSGILVEIARFDNWTIAYHLYFVHLVLVWMFFILAPYTKFAHFFYRTIVMAYAKDIGRI